jgi:hypothetical protein
MSWAFPSVLCSQGKGPRESSVIAVLMFRSWESGLQPILEKLYHRRRSEYVTVNVTERIERWKKAGWKHNN